MRKIKVAQIVGDAKLGGVIRCVLNYYRAIDRNTVQFDFFTYGPSETDEEIRALGGNVFYIPKLTRIPSAIRVLTRLLREGEYDIAHSHMTTLSAVALRAAKRADVSVRICHAHSTIMPESEHRLIKRVLRKFCTRDATHLAACGRFAAENLFFTRAGEAYVMRNAISLDRFALGDSRAEAKAKLGLAGPVIGFVGRFAYQKNLTFLVRAFADFAAETQATLLLVGAGAEEDRIRAVCAECGVSDKVRFLAARGDVEVCYRAMDVFCLPSRYEGLPLVAIEAQAAGVPGIYSTAVTREIDVCPHNAFLPIGDGDEPLWARQMKSALEEREAFDNRDRLAAAGFDIRAAAKDLSAYYGGLLA